MPTYNIVVLAGDYAGPEVCINRPVQESAAPCLSVTDQKTGNG